MQKAAERFLRGGIEMASSYRNYDKSGKKTGTSRRDIFGGYTHYDSKGRKTGSTRQNLFGGYTHYDARGRKTGSSSRQLFGTGYNTYDNRGRKVGSSSRQFLGGGYNYYDAKGRKTGSSQEGCYIATCVYGSYDCPEVIVLRRFRDTVLKRSLPGRMLIRGYYAISPRLVRRFGDSGWFRKFWRRVLDRMIAGIRASDAETSN